MTGNQVVSATFTENVTTLDFIKTALDVDGAPLLVTDTIRYTLQVTNTGPYTAANVVVDRHPAPEYDAREHVHFPGGRFRLQPAGLECR
jgi:hypothetical protein